MNCKEVQDILLVIPDGEVEAGTQERALAHAGQCPQCRAFGESVAVLCAELDAMPVAEPPKDLAAATMDMFESDLDADGFAGWWERLGMGMRSAVCAMAVAGLLFGVALGGTSTLSLNSVSAATDSYSSMLTDSEAGLL